MCQVAIWNSKVPIVVHQSKSTISSFPIQMAQIFSSLTHELQIILKYNMSLSDFGSLGRLINNVCPLELEGDTYEVVNKEFVDIRFWC